MREECGTPFVIVGRILAGGEKSACPITNTPTPLSAVCSLLSAVCSLLAAICSLPSALCPSSLSGVLSSFIGLARVLTGVVVWGVGVRRPNTLSFARVGGGFGGGGSGVRDDGEEWDWTEMSRVPGGGSTLCVCVFV
jgi:hypothetical protein